MDRITLSIQDKLRVVKLSFPSITCYVAGDFNVNLLNDSLPKSRALRSFAAASQLVEATADLPPTWKGKRGNDFVFSKIDHVFTSYMTDIEAESFPFNILSNFLSKQINKKLKEDSKSYRIAQRKYQKYEEALLQGRETQD